MKCEVTHTVRVGSTFNSNFQFAMRVKEEGTLLTEDIEEQTGAAGLLGLKPIISGFRLRPANSSCPVGSCRPPSHSISSHSIEAGSSWSKTGSCKCMKVIQG